MPSGPSFAVEFSLAPSQAPPPVRSAVQVYGTWTAGDGKGAENCVAMAAGGIDSVGTNFATCTKQFEDSRFEKKKVQLEASDT